MLCYILGFFFDWVNLSLIGAIIPVPFLMLMCMIPETPRYQVSKNRERDAKVGQAIGVGDVPRSHSRLPRQGLSPVAAGDERGHNPRDA